MRVRMKVDITGRRHDARKWPPSGEEVVVPDWEGVELCAQGYAEPVAEKPEERAEKRSDNVCGECGFEAKTAAGLGAHQRAHD